MQLFVKALTVLDCSFLCVERGVVGESWWVDVVLEGALDDQNMVLDFKDVKQRIKSYIDTFVDHRLLVPIQAEAIVHQPNDQGGYWVDCRATRGNVHLSCPESAFTWLESLVVTPDTVARHLEEALMAVLPATVERLHLVLRAQPSTEPYYHYTHGLKKHAGNCQRIAHGHRSPLQIWVNDMPAPAWVRYWSERWQDIYLGTTEDQVPAATLTLSPNSAVNDQHYSSFCYDSSQGHFQISLAQVYCDVIPYDTTVELLAQFMAETIAQQEQAHVKVMAYEGIDKGAIAYA
jgi:6-pyruvoyl-tetrahydropterin synthase